MRNSSTHAVHYFCRYAGHVEVECGSIDSPVIHITGVRRLSKGTPYIECLVINCRGSYPQDFGKNEANRGQVVASASCRFVILRKAMANAARSFPAPVTIE